MNGAARRAVDLYKLIAAAGGGDTSPGLRIVRVTTTEPYPVTFLFEGDNQAIDSDLFEIPASLYPLRKDDRYFVFPITDAANAQRWGALEKITGGTAMGTMQSGSTVLIDGVDKVFGAEELVLPPYIVANNAQGTDPEEGHEYYKTGDLRPLEAGDRVSLEPTYINGQVKYVLLNWYGKGG